MECHRLNDKVVETAKGRSYEPAQLGYALQRPSLEPCLFRYSCMHQNLHGVLYLSKSYLSRKRTEKSLIILYKTKY